MLACTEMRRWCECCRLLDNQKASLFDGVKPIDNIAQPHWPKTSTREFKCQVNKVEILIGNVFLDVDGGCNVMLLVAMTRL